MRCTVIPSVNSPSGYLVVPEGDFSRVPPEILAGFDKASAKALDSGNHPVGLPPDETLTDAFKKDGFYIFRVKAAFSEIT